MGDDGLEKKLILLVIVGIVFLSAGFYVGYHTGIKEADSDCVSLVNGVTFVPREDGTFGVGMSHEPNIGEQRIIDKLRGE